MAVNPTYGPIITKNNDDPNGTPGQTSGGVAVTPPVRQVNEPTAGSTSLVPPFNTNPTIDPLAETFAPPSQVAPAD